MNIFAGFCICEVPVPAVYFYYGWFWLAELSLLRYSQVRFYYEILVPCRPFSVRFTSSANLVFLTTSGMRTVHSFEFAPLPVPHLACVLRFSHSFHSPEWYPLLGLSVLQNSKFGGLFRLRSLRKGSGHSGSSIDQEWNICISCSTTIYRLTKLAPFWFFFWSPVIWH